MSNRYKTHQEYFADVQNFICSKATMEEMYQHFKARMMAEMLDEPMEQKTLATVVNGLRAVAERGSREVTISHETVFVQKGERDPRSKVINPIMIEEWLKKATALIEKETGISGVTLSVNREATK